MSNCLYMAFRLSGSGARVTRAIPTPRHTHLVCVCRPTPCHGRRGAGALRPTPAALCPVPPLGTLPRHGATPPETPTGPPTPAVSCGHFYEDLDTKLEKYIDHKTLYPSYFFNVGMTMGAYQKYGEKFKIPKDDDFDRCKRCGRKIGEHPRKEVSRAPLEIPAPADLPWPTLGTKSSEVFPTSANEVVFHEEPAEGMWCFNEVDLKIKSFRYTRLIHKEVMNSITDLLRLLHSSKPSIHKHRIGVLLVGHPGVGKTFFLDVILSLVLDDNRSSKTTEVPQSDLTFVLVVMTEGYHIFVPSQEAKKCQRYIVNGDVSSNGVASIVNKLIPREAGKRPVLLVLHDIKTLDGLRYKTDLLGLLKQSFRVLCVLASSPKFTNHHLFDNEFGPKHHYIPVLNDGEAKQFFKYWAKYSGAFTSTPDDQYCEELIYAVGGVPRKMVQFWNYPRDPQTQREQLKLLGEAAANLPDPLTIRADDMPYRIVRRVDTDESRYMQFDFVSPLAAEVWADFREDEDIRATLMVLLKVHQDAMTRQSACHLYEKLVISSMKLNTCKPLSLHQINGRWVHNAPQDTDSPPTLDLSCNTNTTTSPILNMTTKGLWIPEKRNFPVVDAILVHDDISNDDTVRRRVTLIQITLGDTHPPTIAGLRTLMEMLPEKDFEVVNFAFIVPMDSQLTKAQLLLASKEKKPNELELQNAYNAWPQSIFRVPIHIDVFEKHWEQCKGSSVKGFVFVKRPTPPTSTDEPIIDGLPEEGDPEERNSEDEMVQTTVSRGRARGGRGRARGGRGRARGGGDMQ